MGTYILKRILFSIPMLIGISFISFCVMQLAPGTAGGGNASGDSRSKNITREQYEVMNRTFHLDKPLFQRYLFWLGILQENPTDLALAMARRKAINLKLFGNPEVETPATPEQMASVTVSEAEIKKFVPKEGILYGDFGNSMETHSVKVWDRLAEALPISLMFNIISIVLMYMLAIPFGIYSATHQNSFSDKSISIFFFMLYSMPNFWVGVLLIKLVVELPPAWRLPIQGIQPDNAEHYTTLEWLYESSKYLVLPIVVMTYPSLASLSRYMRAGMINIIREDYIRTARAKGLREFYVIYKHALRNSLIPIITLLGSTLPALIGGSVIIEALFGIPGMGYVGYKALMARDYTVLMADLMLVAVLVMIGFVISDIMYKVADPRITFEGGSR